MTRWLAPLFLLACTQPQPTLDDAPCPCTADFVCCEATGLCVESAAACVALDATVAQEDAAPDTQIRIAAITPAEGPHTGGTHVAISGENLPQEARITIGDRTCQTPEFVGGAWHCTTPNGTSVYATVQVFDLEDPTRPPGHLARGYHYLHPPLMDVSDTAGIAGFLGGRTITMADFDRDGLLDLMFSRGTRASESVEHLVYRHQEDLQFADAGEQTDWLPALVPVDTIHLADFDNDGAPDLLVTDVEDSTAPGQPLGRLLRGRAEGGFLPAIALPLAASGAGDTLRGLPIDINGDGWLDFVGYRDTINAPESRGVVALMNESGTLEAPEAVLPLRDTAPAGAIRTAVATRTSDDHLDLVFCGQQLHVVRMIDGRLTDLSDALGIPALEQRCRHIASADLNLDGQLDLVWVPDVQPQVDFGDATRAGTTLLTFDGTYRPVPAQGSDAASSECPEPAVTGRTLDAGVRAVAVQDFDLDGDWDLFLPSPFGQCASPPLIYDNQSQPGVTAFAPIPIASSWWNSNATGVVVGDLDRDGDAEVAVHVWAYHSAHRLFRGMAIENQSGHSLRVTPRTHGRTAWGAVVDLDLDGPADAPDFEAGPFKRSRAILTASGAAGQGAPELLFGVADRPGPFWLRTTFPDGTQCVTRVSDPDSDVVIERESC